MVTALKENWSIKAEEEISLLLKEWLKQQGKTQSDLKKSLNTISSRMPSLLEALKREHSSGGYIKIAEILCNIENEWKNNNKANNVEAENIDPFDQLDLILGELNKE